MSGVISKLQNTQQQDFGVKAKIVSNKIAIQKQGTRKNKVKTSEDRNSGTNNITTNNSKAINNKAISIFGDVGGFNPEIILVERTPIPENLICQFCEKLMRKPIQTSRGEIACSSCYQTEKGDTDICPIDQGPITNIFPDRAKDREIFGLEAKCMYSSVGCNWTGKLKNLEDHLGLCEYAPSMCSYCNTLVSSVEDHYLECTVLKDRMLCPFKKFGCNYKPNTESELSNHIANTTIIHSIMLTDTIGKNATEHEVIYASLREEILEVKRENTKKDQQIGLLMKRTETLESQLKHVLSKLETSESMTVEVSKKQKSSKATTEKGNPIEIDGKVEKYERELQQMNDTISNISSNLSDLDLRHQLHENTVYDGKMIWKIDNFDRRKQQADLGKTTALHSAPAFTSKYGYKYCSRLYLNGDGMGKGTHLSLFFVIMKSEFDNLLQWPFAKRVTFTLINQDDVKQNVNETFVPDANSSSFQQPRKQMNVASGCPYFVSQEKLKKKGFIKDDCFYLEIIVHN